MPSLPASLAPSTVLVVDDSSIVRVSVARRLRAEGIDVVEAASAAEVASALASLLQSGRPLRCALLDLDLGAVQALAASDGATVAASLRATSPALPVAFFSGEAPDELRARALALGPLFRKPEELEDALAWVLAQVRSDAG